MPCIRSQSGIADDTCRFPKYKPKNNKFSIWTESYGGHWGPTFSDYFNSQNKKIGGALPKSTVPLNLETLGIINGCIDAETQIPLYPVMAYNNTYGLQIINKTVYDLEMQSWPACKKLIDSCHTLGGQKDPAGQGTNADVNAACAGAFDTCFKALHDVYLTTGVSARRRPSPFFTDILILNCDSAITSTLPKSIPLLSLRNGPQAI